LAPWGVHQFPDRLVEVDQRTVLVEKPAGAHSVIVSELYTATPGYPLPMDPAGVPSSRVTITANSLDPKAVDDPAAESPGELLDITIGRLVAECHSQGVVGIVGPLPEWPATKAQRLADRSFM